MKLKWNCKLRNVYDLMYYTRREPTGQMCIGGMLVCGCVRHLVHSSASHYSRIAHAIVSTRGKKRSSSTAITAATEATRVYWMCTFVRSKKKCDLFVFRGYERLSCSVNCKCERVLCSLHRLRKLFSCVVWLCCTRNVADAHCSKLVNVDFVECKRVLTIWLVFNSGWRYANFDGDVAAGGRTTAAWEQVNRFQRVWITSAIWCKNYHISSAFH